MFLYTLVFFSPLTRVSAPRVVFDSAHWCLRVKDSASQYAAVTRFLPLESTYTEQNPDHAFAGCVTNPNNTKQNAPEEAFACFMQGHLRSS
jgi:hypothetical protein